ncbi:MAG TPA: hypothetical protein PLU24_06175, partial [Candidatus Omnitrophota bacterium]|nr:hypothetical protein [Candidatus Omnitrophota bacterium]
PRDEIEVEALTRTVRALDSADIVLFVLDNSDRLTGEDLELFRRIKEKKTIIVVNKSDLKNSLDQRLAEKEFNMKLLFVSASSGHNIGFLEKEIFKSFFDRGLVSDEGLLVSNNRHIMILKRADSLLEAAVKSIDEGMSLEFVSLDVKKALDSLGELTGETFSEELLDVIFSKFCIGK